MWCVENCQTQGAPLNSTMQNGITHPTDGDRNGTVICDIGAFEVYIGVYLPYIAK